MCPKVQEMFQVLIWDVETQPNRHAVLGASESRPDLVCLQQQTIILKLLHLTLF